MQQEKLQHQCRVWLQSWGKMEGGRKEEDEGICMASHTHTRAPAEICGVNADPQQTRQPPAIKRCSEEPEGPESQRTRGRTYTQRAHLIETRTVCQVQYCRCILKHTHTHTDTRPQALPLTAARQMGRFITRWWKVLRGEVLRGRGNERSEGDWIKSVAAGGNISTLIRGGDIHHRVGRLLCLTTSTP